MFLAELDDLHKFAVRVDRDGETNRRVTSMSTVGQRIGPDRAFAAWQRLAVTGVAGLVLVLSNSRIGFVFAASAALVHALTVLYWRRPGLPDYRRGSGLPDYRRRWLAVGTPFVVLALVLVFSGGGGFLVRNRFGDDSDVTSGRVDTWKQVATDWRHAGLAEKAFGDASTSRAVVTRANDGAPPQGPRRKLNTDNAAVGAFRRGSVAGALAFLVGVALLLWHALRRRVDGMPPAAWFTAAAVSVIPTVATEDWLLGGTNGAIWILLLAGEAYLVGRPAAVVTSRRTSPVWTFRPDARSGVSRARG